MADAIRRISTRKGYDPAEYALVSFGGAGGNATATSAVARIPAATAGNKTETAFVFTIVRLLCIFLFVRGRLGFEHTRATVARSVARNVTRTRMRAPCSCRSGPRDRFRRKAGTNPRTPGCRLAGNSHRPAAAN